MKTISKYSYIIFTILTSFISNFCFGELTITVTGSNGNCLSNASITATVSGNKGKVDYELIDVLSSSVIRYYQNSNLFSNLPAGTYKVQAQDASNAEVVLSDPVTLTTTYSALNAIVTDGTVSCATANGTITVAAEGGTAPYHYTILAGPLTPQTQVSGIFNNMPIGIYTISIADACGTGITSPASVALGTATSINKIVPRYCQNDPDAAGAFITFGKGNNKYTDSAFVCIGGGWGYRGSAVTNLTTFDKDHFYWRYIYPSGSGNIYGADGILNAGPVNCTNNYLKMPAAATYPYTSGDLIIYDECGNSTVIKGAIQPVTNIGSSYYTLPSKGDYDCIKGGSIDVNISPYTLIDLPVYYTFTDQTTGAAIKDTLLINNSGSYLSFYGFTPGHTYVQTAVDALGHNASKNNSISIPNSPGNIILKEIFPDYNLLKSGFPRIQFPYTLPEGSTYSYIVTASSASSPAVGYSNSYTISSAGGNSFSDPAAPLIYGPNSDHSWPSGNYTINITAGCLSNSITFTIAGIKASLNGASLTPVCGGFGNLVINATLDNPSLYAVKILAGSPSNVGATRTFGSSSQPGDYSCLPFNGLSYGTYILGLVTTSTSIGTGDHPVDSLNFNYTSSNALIIDALATGGYICSGSSKGSLTVMAYSASGSALQYSDDGGKTWQSSNIFTEVTPGTYPVMVKDVCGNTIMYYASVVQASGISVTISGNKVCVGSDVQLNVNAIGATSCSWTGPNGFTSSVPNPVISNIQSANAGTYSVRVTSAFCTNNASADITVSELPQVPPITGQALVCANSTTQFSDTTTGGIWSSSNNTIAVIDSTGKLTGLNTPGTTTISYTVTNISGCVSIVSQPVTIIASPKVSAIINEAEVCADASTQFSDATKGGVWSSSDNSIATVDTTGKVTGVKSLGTVIISYELTNASGCKTTVTKSVFVNARPTVSAITSQSGVCAGATTQLSDATTGGVWSSSDSTIAIVDATGNVTGINPSGTATIYYSVTNSSGCTTTVAYPVTITFCGSIGLAKNTDEIKLQVDGSYNITFTFVIQNQGLIKLDDIAVSDNLFNTFQTAYGLKIVSLTSTTPSLLVNNNYTGTGTDTSMLLAGSWLAPQQTDSIHLIVNLNPQKINGNFYNTAYALAFFNRRKTTVISSNGLDATAAPSPTPVIIQPVSLKLHIPEGFSPNNDGINERFVLGNDINYNIILEVYNRWGNKVYDSKGYYQNNWNGICNQPGQLFNSKLPDGTYYYIMKVFDKSSGILADTPVGFLTIKR